MSFKRRLLDATTENDQDIQVEPNRNNELTSESPVNQDEQLDIVGTSGYTAPEVVGGKSYSYPADVFSFAIVAWELFATDPTANPLKGLSNEEVLEKVS